MRSPSRVVLDTNIFVSGLINPHGQSARVLFAREQGHICLLIAPALMSEVGQVLRRPHIQARHRLSDTQLSAFLLAVLTSSEVVIPLANLSLTSRDPKDDMFLAVALGGVAEYLVSRDDDLLSLKDAPELGSLRIVTPAELLDILAGAGSEDTTQKNASPPPPDDRA